MKQPSPSWFENTLRNLTLYVKRTDFQNSTLMYPGQGKASSSQSAGGAFSAFKRKLKNNAAGKKSNNNENVVDESMPRVAFPAYNYAKLTGGGAAAYSEEIRKLELLTSLH